MSDLLELYVQLQRMLPQVEDAYVLAQVDQQMSMIEETHMELLKAAAIYALYFPKDHDGSFKVSVFGADAHHVAHLIERLYPKAEVYWFVNANLDEMQYVETMDYVVLAEEMGRDFLREGLAVDAILTGKILKMLKAESKLVMNVKLAVEDDAETYNILNQKGFVVNSIDSNKLVEAKKAELSSVLKGGKAKYQTVYVVCPACLKTGGPELLHQMTYWLNSMGGNAKIAYVGIKEDGRLCHPELAGYVAGHICRFEDFVDEEHNAVVVPEGWAGMCACVKRADLYFWWLSVDNYVSCFGGDAGAAREMVRQIDRSAKAHLVQSAYAKDYVLKCGIGKEKILHLGDYVNQSYLENVDLAKMVVKEDIVLYNPKKGAEYVAGLKAKAPDLHWVAIEKMTTAQVGELMRRAKVYIDFGNHPGKDRIPREAALSGCVVITGRRGSAAYWEDVPIPERYKKSEEQNSYDDVVKEIRLAILQYDELQKDFEGYRIHILQEKAEFIEDLRKIFFEQELV